MLRSYTVRSARARALAALHSLQPLAARAAETPVPTIVNASFWTISHASPRSNFASLAPLTRASGARRATRSSSARIRFDAAVDGGPGCGERRTRVAQDRRRDLDARQDPRLRHDLDAAAFERRMGFRRARARCERRRVPDAENEGSYTDVGASASTVAANRKSRSVTPPASCEHSVSVTKFHEIAISG